MNTAPALPPPPVRPPPSARRRLRGDTEKRAVQIGVIGTVLIHLLLFVLARQVRFHELPTGATTADEAAGMFEVQLAPDATSPPFTPAVPPPPAQPKFVETNPNAPDNIPDKTLNFAAQNQQAAQENPSADRQSDTPAVKGDPTKTATAIVSGNLAEPRVLPAIAPQPPAAPPVEQRPARRPQTPLPGTERAQGETPAAIGTDVAVPGPNPAAAESRVEGQPGATANTGFTIGLPVTIDPLRPQPRPQLTNATVRARPSPLLNNFIGVNHTGITAYDAKWSSHGEYLQRLIDAVAAQWHRIIEQSSVYPETGTRVEISFRINTRGEITQILAVTGNGNADARLACVSGITQPAPYGPWSADMVALLGESQDLTFSFYYE